MIPLKKSFVDFNGVVPEKYDVVSLNHRVNVEYGNVGVDFKFVPREGFGWMNSSYEVGLGYITPHMRRALGALIPTDIAFANRGQFVKSPSPLPGSTSTSPLPFNSTIKNGPPLAPTNHENFLQPPRRF